MLNVSSFWGTPPSANYHPLTVLGKPDCNTFGECAQRSSADSRMSHMAWVSDASSYPELGQRLLHSDLVAHVREVHPSNGTVTVEYHPLYKLEGGEWSRVTPGPAVTAGSAPRRAVRAEESRNILKIERHDEGRIAEWTRFYLS